MTLFPQILPQKDLFGSANTGTAVTADSRIELTLCTVHIARATGKLTGVVGAAQRIHPIEMFQILAISA